MAQETTQSGVTEGTAGPVEMTDERRDELASDVVDRFSLWSGAAGLIPIPFADVAAVGGVQLVMLRRLSEIYGVPFSDNSGKSIIASLAGSVLPASTATSAVSFAKVLPGIGSLVGAFSMPVLSAGATYVIGKVFIQHFASGGTLLDFNPPDYREFIKAQKEKFNARSAPPSPTGQAGQAARAASSKGAAATGS
jgi:uncharacterized protein (DUF697 family)